MKYYGISISGRNTKGVGDQLFNKIRDHWDEIIANGIDYQKLELFDWNQDEFLVQNARDSLELMEKLLDSDSEMFHRGDYKSVASTSLNPNVLRMTSPWNLSRNKLLPQRRGDEQDRVKPGE